MEILTKPVSVAEWNATIVCERCTARLQIEVVDIKLWPYLFMHDYLARYYVSCPECGFTITLDLPYFIEKHVYDAKFEIALATLLKTNAEARKKRFPFFVFEFFKKSVKLLLGISILED